MDENNHSILDRLSSREIQIHSIFEFANLGILLTDPQGNILDNNTTFQKMLGYTEAELIGMNFREITFPEELNKEECLFDQLVRGEINSYSLEKRMLTKDGLSIWVDLNRSAIRDPKGQLLYLLGTVVDISQRRRAEERLRILSRAVEASPVSIIITDREGEIEYANPFFSKLTGFSIDEALGNNSRILKSGKTQPETYAQMWHHILAGQIWEGEFINRKKNGDLYYEQALIAPILDSKGEITHFVAVKDDITERKTSEAALLKQNRTLQMLLEVTLDIATASGSRNLLQRIMQNAEILLEANLGGSIILYDAKLDQLKIVEGSGINKKIVGLTFPKHQGVSGHVFETGKSILIQDYQSWESGFTPPQAKVPGTVIGVPLRIEGLVIGVLTLFADSVNRSFTQQDVRLAEMFAAQAAVAYQNIQLYERTQMELSERKLAEAREREQRSLAEALRDITAILNTSLKLDDVLDQILLTVERVVPYDAINIMLIENGIAHTVRSRSKSQNLIQFSAKWEEPVEANLIFRQMMDTHQVVILTDTHQHTTWSIPDLQWIQSYLGAPIIIEGKVQGFVNLGSQKFDFYNEESARRLQIFASQSALAIRNAGSYAKVQYLAVVDPLLNIYNRRGLNELGRREVERVKRFNRPLSALFLDIDHFKKINDTFEHKIGDEVLTGISDLMKSYIREVDILGRYGGEEFVILLPEIDLDGAVIVAERVRKGIENLQIQSSIGTVFITISIGVAELTNMTGDSVNPSVEEIDLLNGLIERASRMLHVAKENGRNRVEAENEQTPISD